MIVLALALLAAIGSPDLVVSANDGNQVLADGTQVVPDHPAPGSISVIVLSPRPHVVATVPVAASVIGPPRSVAVARDGSFAIVTASRKVDPADRQRIVPDDQVALIDLGGTPHVAAVAHAGAGASGVAINAAGTRALVANRSAGTVSLFAIEAARLRLLATIEIGGGTSPAQPLYIDDERRALVTCDGSSKIVVLASDGDRLRLLPDSLAAGLRPYAIDTAGPRTRAVVGNIGGGGRDVDTVSLIALDEAQPRVVDTVSVGLTPEGLKMSPDGRFVAVDVNNGSNMPHESPRYADHGLLQIWRIDGDALRFVTQAPAGGWGQGIAWSRDGRTILAQAMIGDRIETFAFDGEQLTPGPALDLPAGPAAIAAAGD